MGNIFECFKNPPIHGTNPGWIPLRNKDYRDECAPSYYLARYDDAYPAYYVVLKRWTAIKVYYTGPRPALSQAIAILDILEPIRIPSPWNRVTLIKFLKYYYKIDRNRDGLLTFFEVWAVIELGAPTYEDVSRDIFTTFDEDGDRKLTYFQCSDMMCHYHELIPDTECYFNVNRRVKRVTRLLTRSSFIDAFDALKCGLL